MVLTAFALSPFLLLFILMAVFNKPAHFSAPLVALITSILAYYFWQMPTEWILVSFLKGLGVTIEIMLIIFGAIFLINILKQLEVFQPMKQIFVSISPDKRIQAIIIAWFFVGFIEGIAGFGTPALLAIPILIAIGFQPLTSIVLSLIGDSAAVVFGAVGLPITIGIAQGVGLGAEESLILSTSVAQGATLLNLILSPVIPLILSIIVAKSHNQSWKKGLEVWPVAVLAGVTFMTPSLLAVYLLGPEFPTIIGALIGGSLTIFLLRFRWLKPKNIIGEKNEQKENKVDHRIFFKIIFPYTFIIFLLFITRLPTLPLNTWLRDQTLSTPELFTTSEKVILNFWYSPGLIFILVTFLTILFFKLPLSEIWQSFKKTAKKISLPFFGLFFVLGIVQIMILSGNNTAGLPNMPFYIAERLALVGPAWPIISPFVGALGAFMSGSSTVSNLLFSALQYNTATSIGLSIILILSLQAAGSAIGNMISIHNILAAQAVTDLKNKEGQILRKTIIPMVIYTLLLGVIGLIATLIFF